MSIQNKLVEQLFDLRHLYGDSYAAQKSALIAQIDFKKLRSKKHIETLYDTLLFLMAYPDNRKLYETAEMSLHNLAKSVAENENLRFVLYNSGVTGSQVCADFGFEIVKWLRATYGKDLVLDSFTAHDGQILSILSSVMPQVESEILQDENSTWQLWLKQWALEGDDLLDSVIRLFDQSPIRPEVKDELWTALGIFVTINLHSTVQLPLSITSVHYHRSLIRKANLNFQIEEKISKIKLTKDEAKKIIECARLTLICHLREIDPISFSDPEGVTYYQLSRGMSIALFNMRPERRHPIDSYMGYMVFKNGLPFGYAGSWALFDSARIGLNIFPSFRGGESQHTFAQILKVHKQIFSLNRFSADPYQIGKHNSDGIKSGAFWLYYKMGFRPLKKEQKQLADGEAKKLISQKGYRSPAAVLNKLADSRLEMSLSKQKAVVFDATDLSVLHNTIVSKKYGGDRRKAEADSYQQLLKLLRPGNIAKDEIWQYVVKNWCVVLMANANGLKSNQPLLQTLKALFALKSKGLEHDYILGLQLSRAFRKFMEETYSLYM